MAIDSEMFTKQEGSGLRFHDVNYPFTLISRKKSFVRKKCRSRGILYFHVENFHVDDVIIKTTKWQAGVNAVVTEVSSKFLSLLHEVLKC